MPGQFSTTAPTYTRNDAFTRDELEIDDADFQIESGSSDFDTTPIYARKPKKKGSGASKAVLFGVPALLVAGVVGFLMMQPEQDLMAEAPPAVATAPAATASTSPAALDTATAPEAAAPTQTAAAEPLPVNPTPAQRVSGTTNATPAASRPTQVARARPAPAASAETAGQDASATLPAGPMPYSATTPDAGAAATPSASAPITTPEVAPTAPTTPVIPEAVAPVNPDPRAETPAVQ